MDCMRGRRHKAASFFSQSCQYFSCRQPRRVREGVSGGFQTAVTVMFQETLWLQGAKHGQFTRLRVKCAKPRAA
jgi:hypothetical protein